MCVFVCVCVGGGYVCVWGGAGVCVCERAGAFCDVIMSMADWA